VPARYRRSDGVTAARDMTDAEKDAEKKAFRRKAR